MEKSSNNKVELSSSMTIIWVLFSHIVLCRVLKWVIVGIVFVRTEAKSNLIIGYSNTSSSSFSWLFFASFFPFPFFCFVFYLFFIEESYASYFNSSVYFVFRSSSIFFRCSSDTTVSFMTNINLRIEKKLVDTFSMSSIVL